MLYCLAGSLLLMSSTPPMVLPTLKHLPSPPQPLSDPSAGGDLTAFTGRYKHARPVMKIKTPNIDLDPHVHNDLPWPSRGLDVLPMNAMFGCRNLPNQHKIPFINASLTYKMHNVPKLKYMKANINPIRSIQSINAEIEKIRQISTSSKYY